MEEFKSMAGTDKTYFGDKNFRIRKNGNLVRLHLPRTNLRERGSYVAIDFSLEEFAAAVNAAGLFEIVEVQVPVTTYITKLAVVAAE